MQQNLTLHRVCAAEGTAKLRSKCLTRNAFERSRVATMKGVVTADEGVVNMVWD